MPLWPIVTVFPTWTMVQPLTACSPRMRRNLWTHVRFFSRIRTLVTSSARYSPRMWRSGLGSLSVRKPSTTLSTCSRLMLQVCSVVRDGLLRNTLMRQRCVSPVPTQTWISVPLLWSTRCPSLGLPLLPTSPPTSSPTVTRSLLTLMVFPGTERPTLPFSRLPPSLSCSESCMEISVMEHSSSLRVSTFFGMKRPNLEKWLQACTLVVT
mmetsp:Transcript_14488/g.21286  ORF Transcript_14488/g.21286 Transcript_14488/m.21286 type:complete len:209 (-) Transcript_14488:1332-1958(-)